MAKNNKNEELKSAVGTSSPAENKSAVKSSPKAEVKKETKAKSTLLAKKTTSPKTKSAETKKTGRKTSPVKAADKAAKPAVRKTTAAKRPKKVDTVTIETICSKLEKKIGKKTSIKEKIAVDIEVWGFEDGSNGKMYIELNDGKITVSPHSYDEKSFRVSLSFANAIAFVDGKLSLKDLIASSDFYAEGNIGAAVKLASVL